MLRVVPLLLFLTLLGCGPRSASPSADGRLRVIATTSLVADLARNVGGDDVSVEALMGPGVDPHLYRATEGDVARMAGADLILYNGLHLEGKMVDLLERLGDRARAVADAVPAEQRLAPPEFLGNPDPHVWMDVALWKLAATATVDALSTRDPAHADAYRARGDAYVARLDSVDAAVRARLHEVPEASRVLVTAHDAFNYFGRAYGYTVRGLQGISTATEAGTGDVQDLAAFVSERRVPALFVESSISPRSIEAVRAAVRSRGQEVSLGGSLYSDALGGTGSGAETYEAMVVHNADTIARALAPTPSAAR